MMFDFGTIATMFDGLTSSKEGMAQVDNFQSIDSLFGSAQGKKQPSNFSFGATIGDEEEEQQDDLLNDKSLSPLDIVMRKMMNDSELSTADLISLGK